MEARILKPEGTVFFIEADYNPGFIDAFKRDVPYWARDWIAYERRWCVDNLFKGIVERLLREYYEHVSTTLI